MTAADYEFRGQLERRADGGMWILRDGSTVLRAAPDGTTDAVGFSIDGPDPLATTSTPDGAFVLTHAFGGLLRVAGDGAVSRRGFELPPPPFEPLGCDAQDLAATQDGRLVVADNGCSRLVYVAPDGKVTERELGNLHPYALLARADGSLWFAAENPGDGGTVYRVGPDGAITPFDVPRPPADLAEAPDGAVWAADGSRCRLYRLTDARVERRPAPFTTRQLRFTPDGGLWLMGHTRLAHMSAAEVAAATPARCDLTGPRLTLPDVRGSRLSLRTLRRRGLRLRANEAGHLDAAVQPPEGVGDLPRIVDRALRRGQTLRVRLPAAWLRRPGATLLISGSVTDADGNYGDLPITVKLGS